MNLQYDLTTPYMCSGDDSLIVGFAKTNADWITNQKLFKIVAKTEFISQPIFCGFICTQFGIIREPIHFAMKLALAKVNDTLDNCILNYALEYSYGHKLGGIVDDILNPDQREAHASMGQFLYSTSPGRVRAMMSTAWLTPKMVLKYGAAKMSELKGKTLDLAYAELNDSLLTSGC